VRVIHSTRIPPAVFSVFAGAGQEELALVGDAGDVVTERTSSFGAAVASAKVSAGCGSTTCAVDPAGLGSGQSAGGGTGGAGHRHYVLDCVYDVDGANVNGGQLATTLSIDGEGGAELKASVVGCG
jgi:hypothetical protein